ncbi:hypothetical protein MKUB_10300 [Mycobacterium kubicae]|uniref:Uncharacterized protein n=1 Tax=Mycobacterium kubicae TaxID=120959 RepID=A0ABQ1BII2_9MYCO|nr:hypothetical protein MKUB_10300 [Mycobacterium kubicae]
MRARLLSQPHVKGCDLRCSLSTTVWRARARARIVIRILQRRLTILSRGLKRCNRIQSSRRTRFCGFAMFCVSPVILLVMWTVSQKAKDKPSALTDAAASAHKAIQISRHGPGRRGQYVRR